MDLPPIAMPKPGDDDAAKGLGEISKMAADIVIDRLGAHISAEDQETLVAAMSLVTPWLKAEPKRYALMHGDYRLDNMLFDPDRTRITVVDWQTVGIGLPARDLAYFTATSLEPAMRSRDRARPRRARTTDRCSAYGITDYDLDTCWRDYRLGVVQAPLLVALGTAFAATTERGDEMMLAMLQPRLPGHPRAGHARPDQLLPVDLTQATASSTVDTVRTPAGSGGPVHHHHRNTKCGSGVQLRPGHVAAAVLGHQRVDAVLDEQRELVVVAVRPARQQQLDGAAAESCGVGRGDRADQKPRVDIGEGRDARPPGGQEHPRKAVGRQRLSRPATSDSTTIASPGGQAGRASTRCGTPQFPAHRRRRWR